MCVPRLLRCPGTSACTFHLFFTTFLGTAARPRLLSMYVPGTPILCAFRFSLHSRGNLLEITGRRLRFSLPRPVAPAEARNSCTCIPFTFYCVPGFPTEADIFMHVPGAVNLFIPYIPCCTGKCRNGTARKCDGNAGLPSYTRNTM